MQKITYHDKLVALLVRAISPGSIPLTDGREPLQLVTLKHPRGTYLKAHLHRPRKRVTRTLQECLIVRRGKIKIDLYTPDRVCFRHLTLGEGDIFLLVYGGYGIQFLSDSELIELKNGPFIEDKILIGP